MSARGATTPSSILLLNHARATFLIFIQTQTTTAVCSPWLELTPLEHWHALQFRHYVLVITQEFIRELVLSMLFRSFHLLIPQCMMHALHVISSQRGLLQNYTFRAFFTDENAHFPTLEKLHGLR
jgi:hypothetical protein